MELPFDPVIPLLGMYPKEPKTLIQKNISTPVFIAALLTVAKMWKQPNYPSADSGRSNYGTFTQWNTTPKEILPFATVWMDLENIMLSAISQSEKDKTI